MNRQTMTERVRQSRCFNSKEWFTSYDIATELRVENRQDVVEVLRGMANNGELAKQEIRRGIIPITKWQRRGTNWLTKPWRKTIPPMVYGCPTWTKRNDS